MHQRTTQQLKPGVTITPKPRVMLQRKCACGGTPSLSGECDECRKNKLQRKATQPSTRDSQPSEVPPIVHEVLRSPGHPLDAEVRAFMEPWFGHDFSRVRVHTDSKAAESASAVNASAYTIGPDIVFGARQYIPATVTGRRLLAHELTHVIQQPTSASLLRPLSLGAATGVHENHDKVGSPLVQLDGDVHKSARNETTLPPGTLQRQFLFPPLQGGGYTGIHEREQRSAFAPLYPPGWRPTMRTIKVWFNTFIPMAKISGPPGHDCFTGDDRGFSNSIHASSRTHQEIEFDVTTFAKTIDWKDTGTSHEVDCKTGAVEHTGKAPVSELNNGGVVPDASAGQIKVAFQVSATNPLVTGAPAIDADVVFQVDPVHRRCTLFGEHDGFPAYEAYVTAGGGAGNTVYTYDPRTAGEGILALFPPMDKVVSGTGTTF